MNGAFLKVAVGIKHDLAVTIVASAPSQFIVSVLNVVPSLV